MFLGCVALLTLTAAIAPAQIRLHDQGNEDLSKKTRDAFEEFSRGDANVFETMIANTLALKTATLAELYELNRQSRRDTVNVIPALTWEQLAAVVDQRHQEFLTAYNAARLIEDPLRAGSKDAQGALADAQARLKKLQKDKTDLAAKLGGEAPKLEDLKKSLDDLRDAVAGSIKPVKKLSDLAEFQSLKNVWTNVQNVKDWLDAAEKAANAPGLQMTILELGVQHQQFQVDRLKLQVEQAEAAEKIAARIEQRLTLVWGDGSTNAQGRPTGGLLGQIYFYVLPCPAGADCSGRYVTDATKSEQVIETLGKLSAVAKDEVGKPIKATMQLRNLLDVLGRYTSLSGYHKYLLLADTIEAGVDTHLLSIRLSALNTRDREMLVSRGLDGLAAYHAGGLKPEEIANFFRAAQSIAVGVLAGRGR